MYLLSLSCRSIDFVFGILVSGSAFSKILKIAVTIPSHIDLERFALKLLIGTWSRRVIAARARARFFRAHRELLAGSTAAQLLNQPGGRGGIHGRDGQRGVPSGEQIGESGRRRYVVFGVIGIVRYTGTRKKRSEVSHWYLVGYLGPSEPATTAEVEGCGAGGGTVEGGCSGGGWGRLLGGGCGFVVVVVVVEEQVVVVGVEVVVVGGGART